MVNSHFTENIIEWFSFTLHEKKRAEINYIFAHNFIAMFYLPLSFSFYRQQKGN